MAIVVSGPSGAGKNSVIDRVIEQLPGLEFSVSYTTRARRPREREGIDYCYVSDAEFDRLLAAGEFVEHVTYSGNRYATARCQIDQTIADGCDVILNIDVEGAKTLRRTGLGPHAVVYVFLVPSSLHRLEERLQARGTETDDQIAHRLTVAAREMETLPLFDFLVINDDFEDAVSELRTIVLAERLRITMER